MDAGELERTLAQVISPSSDAIKSASERLRTDFYGRPETVPALVHILQHHPERQMRQLAGVEVRKLAPRFWEGTDKALPRDVQEQIKQTLLESTFQEPDELVRHTSARVLSSIAREDLDADRWPKLVPALFNAAMSSPDADQREVAVYILYTLLDTDYAYSMTENSQELLQLLAHTVKDSSAGVRMSSVLALCCVGDCLGHTPAASHFPQFVPAIVDVLGQAVAADDEKTALKVFEQLTDLLASDPALIGETFGQLLEHMVSKYAAAATIDTEYRLAALRFVGAATAFKMSRIKAMKWGPELVKALVSIMATADDEDDAADDDEEDDDEDTVVRLAQRALRPLATQLPPKQAISPLIDLLPELVRSQDPRQLRAGYHAFTAAVSGAPEFVRAEFPTVVLPWLVAGLNHGDAGVRLAAIQALSSTGLELPDEVGEHHAQLVPVVFGIMDSAPSVRMAFQSCTCLDIILGTLTSDVITSQYLGALVPKLLALVDGAPVTKLKGAVVQAIASAAGAAGHSFSPFFDQTIQVVQKFIVLPPPTDNLPVVKLSGETLGALGMLCVAVGADQFRPYLQACMEAALAFITSEESALKDNVPMFLSSAAGVFGEEVGPFLPQLMPHIFASFSQKELEGLDFDDADADAFQKPQEQPEMVGGDEDEDEDDLHVNTAVALEKEYMCDCLSELWVHCPATIMAPYLDATLQSLGELIEHFFEDIRAMAVETAWNVAIAVKSPEVVRMVWQLTSSVIENEDFIDVMERVFDSVARGFTKLGAAALGPQQDMESLLHAVIEVATKEHRAVQDFDGDDEATPAANDADDDPQESPERVVQLLQSAFDLVVALARVMGKDFMPLFPQIAQVVKPYTQSPQTSERVVAVGAVAELTDHLGGLLQDYVSDLLLAFGQGLGDRSELVRSVAAWGMGILCAKVADDTALVPHYSEILIKVQQGLLAQPEYEEDRSVANGVGCVARMALRHPETVPLDEIVPILVSKLPLRDGYEEYPPVLSLLAKLAEQGHAGLAPGSPVRTALVEACKEISKEQHTAEQRASTKASGPSSEGAVVFPLGDSEAAAAVEAILKM